MHGSLEVYLCNCNWSWVCQLLQGKFLEQRGYPCSRSLAHELHMNCLDLVLKSKLLVVALQFKKSFLRDLEMDFLLHPLGSYTSGDCWGIESYDIDA